MDAQADLQLCCLHATKSYLLVTWPMHFFPNLSHNVASGNDITPCNNIDKPLMVYIFSNVAYIRTESQLFHALNRDVKVFQMSCIIEFIKLLQISV